MTYWFSSGNSWHFKRNMRSFEHFFWQLALRCDKENDKKDDYNGKEDDDIEKDNDDNDKDDDDNVKEKVPEMTKSPS